MSTSKYEEFLLFFPPQESSQHFREIFDILFRCQMPECNFRTLLVSEGRSTSDGRVTERSIDRSWVTERDQTSYSNTRILGYSQVTKARGRRKSALSAIFDQRAWEDVMLPAEDRAVPSQDLTEIRDPRSEQRILTCLWRSSDRDPLD